MFRDAYLQYQIWGGSEPGQPIFHESPVGFGCKAVISAPPMRSCRRQVEPKHSVFNSQLKSKVFHQITDSILKILMLR